MAGIGFKLKEMLMEDTYTGTLKAYVYSAVISSGPWLLSILCLSLLGGLTPVIINQPGSAGLNWPVFSSTIIYVFATSLITTGLITYILNRYIADKIFLKEYDTIPSTYISLIIFIIVIQGISGFLFFSLSMNDLPLILSSMMLYITISCIWIALIFLSVSENYNRIVLIFALGSAISVLAALFGGRYFDLTGFFLGFVLGQVTIFFGFSYELFSDFGLPKKFNIELLDYCKKYYHLVFIGFFYYIATWADKIVFWFSECGQNVYGFVRICNDYDFPLFLAYLSIIPALAIFLLNIETDFYQEYQAFYKCIIHRKSYKLIHKKKVIMEKLIRKSLMDLGGIQGLITLLAIYFAPDIFNLLGVQSALSLQIFRYTLIGVFFHAYILIISIILLYYDLRKDVLIINAVFAATMIGFTWLTVRWGSSWYGIGQLAASASTFCLGILYLRRRLKQLEFLTFMKQPMVGKIKDNGNMIARPGRGYGKYVFLKK